MNWEKELTLALQYQLNIINMGRTILVIDDNNDIRENTAEILDLAGYTTFHIANVECVEGRKNDVG